MKNLKLKIIISVYFCLISLALYNTIFSYFEDIDQQKQTVFAQISTLSNLVATEIDGDLHEKIISKYKYKGDIKYFNQDSDYMHIHDILLSAQKAAKIKTAIYTLVPTENKQKLLFGITSSMIPYYKHQYGHPPASLINNFNKGGYIDEYADENGVWLSSFSPIKNKAGKVVAVVQSDLNYKDFMFEIHQKLIGNISYILLMFVVIGFLLYLFLKDVLKKDEIFSKTQQKYNDALVVEVANRTIELQVLNNKLVKVNKELASFFYSTSHDVRGPLCRILGLTSLAKLEDDKQELVELIEIESLKMDDMLKKMILVNNIRIKTLKIEAVSINDTVNSIIKEVKENQPETKTEIKISTEIQKSKSFNSDSEILNIILYNLIDNAFKFSDAIKPEIRVNSTIDINGVLSLTISNNGSKFTEKELHSAFELFKNASDYSEKTDGIKLGLYTVKTAIDQLNGLIHIDTDTSGMTVIKVIIPDYYIAEGIKNSLSELAITES